MPDKIAFITGITGQDGAYLAELLLNKGYVVHGVKRRASSFNTGRVDHLYDDPHKEGVRFFMHYGDMTDATNLIRLIQETEPTEIYNMAAQSHVQVSFETPEYTANSDALGTLRILEAIRIRQRPRNAAKREHTFPAAEPLRRSQVVRLLDHRQLPRGLWLPCVERHSV